MFHTSCLTNFTLGCTLYAIIVNKQKRQCANVQIFGNSNFCAFFGCIIMVYLKFVKTQIDVFAGYEA